MHNPLGWPSLVAAFTSARCVLLRVESRRQSLSVATIPLQEYGRNVKYARQASQEAQN